MPTDDVARFRCQDPACDSHGRRGDGNILVIDRFGKAPRQLRHRRSCTARSSEFKGTPFSNSNMLHDKILAVLEQL